MKLRMNQYMDLSLAAIVVVTLFGSIEAKASSPTTFGEKTAWHGFDRYDFLMDEKTLAIKPIKAAADERNTGSRVRRRASGGVSWSFRKRRRPGTHGRGGAVTGTTSHRAEVELLKRGFHIAFITPTPARHGTRGTRS